MSALSLSGTLARRSGALVMIGLLVAPLQSSPAFAQGAKPGPAKPSTSTTSAPVAPPAAPAKPPLSSTLTGQAREAYEAGRVLFTDGDHAGALLKFRQAHELSREPRLLWNMAVCEKALRRYGKTRQLIERYLAEAPGVSAEERGQAKETLDLIARLVGRVTIVVEEPAARVSIDGEPAGESPLGVLELDIGRHVIRAEKPGFEPAQEAVEIAGGAERRITLVLARTSRAATLSVRAPAAAAIAVDGQVRGRGTWTGQLDAGPHDVRVTAPGYRDHAAVVDLAPSGTRSLDITLQEKPARWPWVVGGAAVVAGAVVGGYFLFRSKPEPTSSTRGTLDPGQVRLPLSPAGVSF